jgi:CRP-like cAMP-binding protein
VLPQSLNAGLQSFISEAFACPDDVAASIGRRAIERRYRVNTVILKQGDRADATFLIASGRAHALIYGPEGQFVLLHEYARGDFFGAIADPDPQPENASVVAIEELRAAVFQVLDFLGLVDMYSCVGRAVSRMLLKQLRTTSAKMAERTILSATGRVHAELLRLARLGDGRTIRPAPVLTSLAVRVQSTRETVSRTISALERRGIIRRELGALVIVAPHRLEELVV